MQDPNIDRVRISKTVNYPGEFISVAREPNSERLWIGHTDFKIYTVDFSLERPQAVPVFKGHNSYVTGLGLAGRTLISASWDRTLKWWDVETRQLVRTVDAHQLWIRQMAVHSAQNLLATVSDDLTCKLWDAQSGRLVRQLTGFELRLPNYDYPNKLFACAFSPDGRYVAAADEMCRVLIWETENGRQATRFDARRFFREDWERTNLPYGGIRCMAFAPNGQALALAGMDNTDVLDMEGASMVQIFDWQTGRQICEHRRGGMSQFESLFSIRARHGCWLHPVPEAWASLYFLDPAQPRVLKQVSSTMQTFALTFNENLDAFYAVGRGKALKWEFPA